VASSNRFCLFFFSASCALDHARIRSRALRIKIGGSRRSLRVQCDDTFAQADHQRRDGTVRSFTLNYVFARDFAAEFAAPARPPPFSPDPFAFVARSRCAPRFSGVRLCVCAPLVPGSGSPTIVPFGSTFGGPNRSPSPLTNHVQIMFDTSHLSAASIHFLNAVIISECRQFSPLWARQIDTEGHCCPGAWIAPRGFRRLSSPPERVVARLSESVESECPPLPESSTI